MILYKNGLVLRGSNLVTTDIVANHGKIIEIAPCIVADEQTEVVECEGKYVLPALVDLHTHGALGYDFNTADADGMKKIIEFYVAHGVGTFLPTLTADSDEVICRQVKLICELAKDYPEIKGINLEGPFISPEMSGGIDAKFLQKPSADKFYEYQKAANGFIKMITVAPELPDAIPFISEIADGGVVVSIGHSNANGRQVKQALDAGAKSFTHFGNFMSQMGASDLNVTGSAMLYNAFAEVVMDGKSANKDVVSLLTKTKGEGKIIGTTNSSKFTGLADGNYRFGNVEVVVAAGDAYYKGTNLRAGSMLDAYAGLANTVAFCNLPLAQAIAVWTVNPAKLIGMESRIGTIEIGKDADFIIFG